MNPVHVLTLFIYHRSINLNNLFHFLLLTKLLLPIARSAK